jgi:signal transduction histidine kinase
MTELIDNLPDAVVALDAGRCVTTVNEAACTLLQRTRADLIGRPLGEVLTPANPDVRVNGWHRSARLPHVKAIPEQDVEVKTGQGGTVRVAVTGRYQRASDGLLEGAVLVLRPVGRRVHLASAGIEVISTVSHELRSPLTSVKGYTSLLLNRWDRLTDEQKRMMLEQVQHDADRVTRLVTELLDISRLESGKLRLRRQMVDVVELTKRVVEKVTMAYPDLEVQSELPYDLPTVYADPDKVEQVLTNLLENAAKYADGRHASITARVDGDINELSVAVSDRGQGIPPDDVSRLFTKFFRSAEGRPSGSGLGLYIAKGLVQAHGGRLVAESTVGFGSTFTFVLPTDAFEKIHGAGAEPGARG